MTDDTHGVMILTAKRADVKMMEPVTYNQSSLVATTSAYQDAPFRMKRTIGIYLLAKKEVNKLINLRNRYVQKGTSADAVFKVTLTPLLRLMTSESYSTRERSSFRKKTSEVVASTLLKLWAAGLQEFGDKALVEKPVTFYVRFPLSEPTIVLLDEYFVELLRNVGYVQENTTPSTLLNAEKNMPVVKISTKFIKEGSTSEKK